MMMQSQDTIEIENYYLGQAQLKARYAKDRARFASNPAILAQIDDDFATEMTKGVPGITLSDINPSIPQDLDPVYRSLDAKGEPFGRNMILRGVPKVQGAARIHEYVLQTSTGLGGTSGASSELGVGNSVRPTQQKMTSNLRWLKLHYLRSSSVDEVRSIGDNSETQNRENLRRLTNQALIWGDTTTNVSGESGFVGKGLRQLIKEGTNGTSGLAVSEYNYNGKGHVWDWRGQAPSLELMRQGPRELFSAWGSSNNLHAFMPSRTMMGLEALNDANRRGSDPFAFVFQGQGVSGLTIGGRFVPYIPEDDLNPFMRDSIGFYNTKRPVGAPTGAPTFTAAQQTEGTTDSLVYGLWDSNPYGAGDVRYGITYFDEEDRESTATLGDAVTVTSGGIKDVKLTISGVPANATRVRIYRYDALYGSRRGISSPAIGNACWIMDAAPPGDGSSFVVIDHNEKRPYCGTGLLLNMTSATLPYLTGAEIFEQAKRENKFEDVMPFVSEERTNWTENAVREVYVGPTMFQRPLANSMDTRYNYLIGNWRSVEITNPYTCGILENLPLT